METPVANQAFVILKLLRAVIEEPIAVEEKLNRITRIIAEQMNADAAACFINIDDTYLEMFSSSGFKEGAAHKVSFRIGEGLVGNIAKYCRPLSVSDVISHPKHVYHKDLGNDDYQSLLGVPLIRRNRAVGVLLVAGKEQREYSSSEQETMETVAMFVADIVTSDEMNEYKKDLIKQRGLVTREKVKGISLSKGYGLGNAVLHRRRHDVTKIIAEDKDKELDRLTAAHTKMNEDLDAKFNSTKLGIGEHMDILDAYLMFAKDKGWFKKIADNVMSGLTAEAAIERAYEDMWNRLSSTTDNYLKERLHDLRDVADRLHAYLNGDYENSAAVSDSNDIVVIAQTLGPAELMDYDYHKIRGLIIEDGTPTMHVAIVAKALNIPVVAKIKGLFDEVDPGDMIAIDGNEGYVYLKPSAEIRQKFKNKIEEKLKLQEKLAELHGLPSKTLDGVRISHAINVGLAFDLDYLETTNADGVGLYRTEIPFMASSTMPDVEQQTNCYKELMERADGKKVIFRSLDVGSDKLLPYWAGLNEENPAIGWRSIRITLDRRAILRKQIRAFLAAAEGKELNIMFPMISDLAEFEEAKETLLLELEKERKFNRPVPTKVNAGLMIEVPSVIFQLDEILPKADFISVGTNDLAQFIFACDRGNPRLTERYDVLSAPFLRVMRKIVEKADEYGVYCSVCGEMASNPIEAMALIGLGYRNISSSGSSYGRVKSMIRTMNVKEVSDFVQSLLKSSCRTLRPQLFAYACDHGIEIY